jgi:hypothetical protein
VWDVGAIYVNADADGKSYVGFIRQPRPGEAAGKELGERWSEMLDGKGDFVPERGHDEGYKKLWRRAAIGADHRPGSPVDRNATLLYEVISFVQDAPMPRRIDDMQDVLLENVRVKER